MARTPAKGCYVAQVLHLLAASLGMVALLGPATHVFRAGAGSKGMPATSTAQAISFYTVPASVTVFVFDAHSQQDAIIRHVHAFLSPGKLHDGNGSNQGSDRIKIFSLLALHQPSRQEKEQWQEQW